MRPSFLAHVGRVLVAALAGLALLVPAPATAADAPCQRTFSSGVVNVPIRELGQTRSDIDVPEDGLPVTDVDVGVNIRHPALADLEIFLTSTDDAIVFRSTSRLFDHDGGGGGEDLLGTVFDDEATVSISQAIAPVHRAFPALGPGIGSPQRVHGWEVPAPHRRHCRRRRHGHDHRLVDHLALRELRPGR